MLNVTEIEPNLVRPKIYSHLLVVFLSNIDQLGETTTHVLDFKPESFESYDDQTLKAVLKHLPQLMKQMGGNPLTLAFRFVPEMLAAIESGHPKLVLMAEFTGDTGEEALLRASKAHASLKSFHERTRVTKSEGDEHTYWVIRRESFNMLRENMR